ncbi:MAG TPA: ZIP family metal transporter [Burkholderiaceae bacterium]|nr:ZIP family metal transporter [Burkholderiaceae bacterium]
MTLASILAATLLAGVVSVLAAAWLSFSALARLVPRMVSLSAGLLLATAVLHLLPEGFESDAGIHELSWTLLIGLVAFFLLEKLAVLRHSHHHEGDGHGHGRGHDHHEAGPGGMLILVGDSIHNFADGVLIAAAFLADPALGWLTALALATHEIPQELGDFIVLLNAGYTRRRALAFNLLSGLAAVAGGVIGFFALEHAQHLVPYVVIIAAAGFIYIALADLVPVIQRRNGRAESAGQVLLMIGGIAIVALVTARLHVH